MGDHSNRTWCHVLPSVAHILLIFLTHGTQPVSQKKFLTKFYHVQNTTKKISNKKILTKIAHEWNRTCKPKKSHKYFLTHGTQLISKKFSHKIFSTYNPKKLLTHGTNLKSFSQNLLMHRAQPVTQKHFSRINSKPTSTLQLQKCLLRWPIGWARV